MDNDLDGAGEFGCFTELSGVTPLNARGNGPPTPLMPPILASTFRNVDASGRVSKSGYFFMLYLPDAAAAGVPDIAGGGPSPLIGDDNCEAFWSAFAWPVQAGSSGNRTFFVSNRGEVFQTHMAAVSYSGPVIPPWDAPLVLVLGTMADPIALSVPGIDGNDWVPVN